MRFDAFWTEETSADTQSAELPIVPDGRHVARVVSAEWRDVAFKVTDSNPNGTTLQLRLSVDGHQVIEDLIPATFRGLIEAVAASAGIAAPNRHEDWDETQLVGKFCPVDTTQGVAKSGRTYVNVKYIKGPPQAAPVQVERRVSRVGAAGTAKPLDGGLDDIPF